MLDLIKRLDFWLTIGAIVFFVMLEFDKLRAWWGKRSVKRSWYIDPGIMSRGLGSESKHAGSGTGATDPVSAQQNQVTPEPVSSFDGVIDYLKRHKLATPEQLIDVLSVLQFEDDSYPISANKIRDLAGGNEAAVKARVASHRPKAAAPKPSPRMERPVNGW